MADAVKIGPVPGCRDGIYLDYGLRLTLVKDEEGVQLRLSPADARDLAATLLNMIEIWPFELSPRYCGLLT